MADEPDAVAKRLGRAIDLAIVLRGELEDDPDLLILIDLLLIELARKIALGP